MRTFDAETTAALAARRRVGALAVRLVTVAGREYLWTNWPTALTVTVTIGGSDEEMTFQPTVLRLAGALDVQSPNASVLTLELVDPAGTLPIDADADLLTGASCMVWLLLSRDVATNGWGITLLLDGTAERAGADEMGLVALEVGPNFAFWAGVSPPAIGTTCWYNSTALCDYALSCAKTVAACTANSQLAKFGGIQHLLLPGTTIEFRDGTVTTSSASSGPVTTPPVVVQVP